MGLFGKKRGAMIDPDLPDAEWMNQSRILYDRTISDYYGSPETMASGGVKNYDAGNFGTAMLFFQKAIDMLHTAYGFSEMQSRRPSDNDTPIIGGFLASLEDTLKQHPEAAVWESVREVTHRLRSISTTCDDRGLASARYRHSLDRLAQVAPQVNVDDVFWH
jgi:hypothetical protein